MQTEVEPEIQQTSSPVGMPMNHAPKGDKTHLSLREKVGHPQEFLEFLRPLHEKFTPRQQELLSKRHKVLNIAHHGTLPQHLAPSEATKSEWKIALPEWVADQRNQMTGPADDAELVVKMLNSGAPGVMLDLEDSMANRWENLQRGIENILSALRGELTYNDKKRQQTVGIKPSKTVIQTRARGLHISQAGVFAEPMSASLYDVARIVYQADFERLKHPLTFYIPKTESAEEALWWRDLFQRSGALQRAAEGQHQVHGAGGIASAGIPDRRVHLQLARPPAGAESGPVGLHGEPDPLQPGRSELGAARSQHHSA